MFIKKHTYIPSFILIDSCLGVLCAHACIYVPIMTYGLRLFIRTTLFTEFVAKKVPSKLAIGSITSPSFAVLHLPVSEI